MGRQDVSARWTVPVQRSGRSGGAGSRARRDSSAAPLWSLGWMLLELPTALLLGAFVGTGWLGYLQHDSPDRPRAAVVAPAPQDPSTGH